MNMKKIYIQPSAEIINVSTEKLLVASVLVNTGSDTPTVGGGDAMSQKSMWDDFDWSNE